MQSPAGGNSSIFSTMNTHRSVVAWVLALALIVPATSLFGARPARADQPNTMSYQGRLKDSDGVAVANGDYDFEFRLYDDLAGGALLWEEEQLDVTVTDGYFAVSLGSVDGFFDGVDEDFDFSEPAFLGVEVEGDDEMVPRVAANSVAYAFVSRGLESYTSELTAEAAADPYAGRMYYNTTDGNVYTYDGVEAQWEKMSAMTLDDAYDNFGATASKITLDAAEGQTGGLEFESGMAGDIIFDLQSSGDVSIQNNAVEFASFNDDGSIRFGEGLSTVSVNGTNFSVNTQGEMVLVSDGSDNTAITIEDAGYTNSLSIADNSIIGTTAAIDLTNFDVDADGNITVANGLGLDTNGAGALALAGTNALELILCNSANCDTINIATNVDADAINIGENNDTLTINTAEFDVSSATGGITIDDDGDSAVISVDGSTMSRDVIQFATTAEIHSGVNAGLTIWGGDNGVDLNEDVQIVSEDWSVDAAGTVNASGFGLMGDGVLFWQDNLESISNQTDQVFTFVSSSDDGDITLLAENVDGDANLIVAAQGGGTLVLDTATSGFGSIIVGQNTTAVTVCSSADCDAVSIATNADADVISIGDALDTLNIDAITDFDAAVDFAGGVTHSAGEFLFAAGNVQLNDNVVLQLGSGSEFEIVHTDSGDTDFTNIEGDLTFTTNSGALILDSDSDTATVLVNLATDGTFMVESDTGVGLFQVNDDMTGVDIMRGDLVVSEGYIGGSNSEGMEIGIVDGTFAFGRNNAGIVTLTSYDNDADTDLTIDPAGTGALSLVGDGASSINFAEFDVSSVTGAITIDDDDDLGSVTVDGSMFSMNELEFVGNATVSTLAGDLTLDAADDLILTGTDGVSINGASTQFSGDITVLGGDIHGSLLGSTSIDLGEEVVGAISFIAGTANFIFNTDADSSMSFDSAADGSDVDIGTATNEMLRISPNGTGDIEFVTDADTIVQLTGVADETASMVMNMGDLVLSDGGIQVLGGDFDAMLDSDDVASFTHLDMDAGGVALEVTAITDADNAGTANGMNIITNYADYADDDVADNRVALSLNVTNEGVEAAGAGEGDNIVGLFVAPLLGTPSGFGTEAAIRTSPNWDMDWYMANAETVSNQTEDLIVFNGTGGTNNTSLTVDLDGDAATVPTLIGGASDVVAINDSLSVGVDGTNLHSITHGSFVLTGGNDLYVADKVGVNGEAFFDEQVSFGSTITFADDADTTPNVSTGNVFLFNPGAPLTITGFDNGFTGQVIYVRGGGATVTLDCTSINCGTTNVAFNAGDFAVFMYDGAAWHLLSMMDDSDNHNIGIGFDLAEWFPSSEELTAGDVVSVDPSASAYVQRSQSAYETSVIGIVSTDPGITLGEPSNATASKIALAGRVPVNVSNENGDIAPGDYLTTSSTPGFAMKATEAGPVIGVALESFDGASGQVLVKVSNFWYSPSSSISSSLQDASSTDGMDADTSVVVEDVVFEGSVTVREHLYASADTAGRARIVAGDTRVHIPFEVPYEQQPIVNATLRTETNIPGYWWVEEESTTGFDLRLDGTLQIDAEFNWIAIGVEDGTVTVSDGSTRNIEVYVRGSSSVEDSPSSDSSSSSSSSSSSAADTEESVAATEEAPVADEPVTEEVVAEESVTAEEEAVSEPVAEETAPATEESAPASEETSPAEEPVVAE